MPETVKATRFAFRQLLELDACTRCGECVKWCPKEALSLTTPDQRAQKARHKLAIEEVLGPRG